MEYVLALGASLLWGSADFMGGNLSRRLHPVVVTFVSQAFALALVVVAAAVFAGYRAPGAYLWWGVAAGLVGAGSLAAFYRALATGTMGVVAPIAAAGVAVPVIVGLVSGERPGPLRLAGIVGVVVGIILASGPELREAMQRRRAVLLAMIAAVGFGTVYVCIAKGAETSVAMTLIAQRASGVALMGVALLATRGLAFPKRRDLPVLGAVGAMDVGANGAFGLASTMGALAITATLSSLYPIVTAVLARIVLEQRMRRIQLIGVVCVMAGVVLLTI